MPGGGKLTFETANVTFDEDQAGHPAAIERGSYVRLTVSDTGCGMDAPTRARAFEPFFTTKGHGKGTGLGLATVYGIVKQSGGGVWVSSEPDVGTSFQVFLPRTSQAIAVHPSPPPVATPTTGTETILVVEDEGAIRTLVTRILSAAGYTVVTATNGAEALRVCEEMPEGIDLVLTDVVMPEMNGRILAEHLAQRRPGIKVMFMSGYAEDAIVHPELLEAETHFLGKPFTPDELTRKVRERLDDGVSSASRSPRGAVA
jgi:two-component system cell cycle sensor histidine kinase/response regulator CckA